MKFDRNLVVFVGPSAAGKTEGMNILRGFLFANHIPYEDQSITDARSILEQIKRDDRETGGRNHFHEWCEGITTGHSHAENQPDLGFTVTGYRIPRGMYRDFTHVLSEPRSHDKLFFVEWSGAASKSQYGDADYAFARMRQEFKNGSYSKTWFSQVLAIIHPWVPDFDGRLHLNHLREGVLPTDEEMQTGKKSWFLPRSAMELFHDDDFETEMRPYLEAEGLGGRIYTIINGGENEFVEGKIGYHARLLRTYEKIFAPLVLGESQDTTLRRDRR